MRGYYILYTYHIYNLQYMLFQWNEPSHSHSPNLMSIFGPWPLRSNIPSWVYCILLFRLCLYLSILEVAITIVSLLYHSMPGFKTQYINPHHQNNILKLSKTQHLRTSTFKSSNISTPTHLGRRRRRHPQGSRTTRDQIDPRRPGEFTSDMQHIYIYLPIFYKSCIKLS